MLLWRLQQSGLFDSIVCTDSHPRAHHLHSDFLEVVSVAQLLLSPLRETV